MSLDRAVVASGRWTGSRASSALVLTLALPLMACDRGAPVGRPRREPPPVGPVPVPVSEAVLRDGPPTFDSEAPAPAASARTEAAARRDDAHDSDALVPARRLVYRVTLTAALVTQDRAIPSGATAELYVDVSEERLRARFEGVGWPVPSGSEVRLSHEDGAYVYEPRGGRPLPAGLLAQWFYGGPLAERFLPPAGVAPPPPQEQGGPGAMLCALVSEWAGQPREVLARRCAGGGAPQRFRVGPWRAERTADVPVELPRRALRADDVGPPRFPEHVDDPFIVPPASLARRGPAARRAASGTGALTVRNLSGARALLLVEGIPLRWFDAGEEVVIDGVPTRRHMLAAIRPFGHPAHPPRVVEVPGVHEIR